MERRNPRRTVLPGDDLEDVREFRPGENTYVADGRIRAGAVGSTDYRGNTVSVNPAGGRYVPKGGDTVIGVISDVGPSNWMIDIKAPWPAPLHVSEVPWKVEFGDTTSFLTLEDVVLIKILNVDEGKKVSATMKDAGLRKIEGGRLVEIDHNKISRVIGKAGSMISMIKDMTDCRMTVGQNGRIWIDGEGINADAAAAAIKKIEAEANMPNLTERIEDFIAEVLPESHTEHDEEEVSE